ncbi:SGNH/GDSL hydrolase family protein [Massilia sp. TSP1-1-2]|uniref:SGNH/GDSL hydrolase family protein n=1 Tax=unclassified Massilia TaxID=2609279 RepID=UPI003CFB3368
MCLPLLDTPVTSTAETLILLANIARDFELAYRKVLQACLALALPLVVCTIYNGNFPDTHYQQRATVALTVFNDVILRVAVEHGLKVIDLRLVCTSSDDYANPIEPSVTGGGKIAGAIVQAITEPNHAARGANVVS